MKIKTIKKISRNNETVYNLTVKDNHNYFANGILVSNCHTCLAKSTSEMIQNIKTIFNTKLKVSLFNCYIYVIQINT